MFYTATAWPAGLTPRFNADRRHFNVETGEPFVAGLKSESFKFGSATARSRRPIPKAGWRTIQLREYWEPDEIRWDFVRLSRSRPYQSYFRFNRTEALVSYPGRFENTAEDRRWTAYRTHRTPDEDGT